MEYQYRYPVGGLSYVQSAISTTLLTLPLFPTADLFISVLHSSTLNSQDTVPIMSTHALKLEHLVKY